MSEEKAIEKLENGLERVVPSTQGSSRSEHILWLEDSLSKRETAMKEAIAELEQPKCETCGGSGEILVSARDPLSGGIEGEPAPCPDCQQPELAELTLLDEAACELGQQDAEIKKLKKIIDRLTARMEELEAENKEQKELIDRLCSQEPCPKCGYGVTPACYGCEIKRLKEELQKLRKDLGQQIAKQALKQGERK